MCAIPTHKTSPAFCILKEGKLYQHTKLHRPFVFWKKENYTNYLLLFSYPYNAFTGHNIVSGILIKGMLNIRSPNWIVFDHLTKTIKISFSNKISPLVNYFLLSNFDIEIGTKLDFRLIVKKAIKNRHQQTLSNDFSISKCLYVSLSTPGEIFQQKIIFP